MGSRANSQVDAPGALRNFSMRTLDSAWRPEVLAYIRNTEFFHPAEEGRTRFGALLGLRRHYSLKDRRSAELGMLLNQSFGAAPQVLPWLVLRAEGAHYRMQVGSVADRGHDLPRQLLNPDLRYAVPVVYGLSGDVDYRAFRAAYWVEWLKAIDYGSPFKEQIHGGLRGGWVGPKFALEGVLQYHHVGGQIDALPRSVPAGNRLNYGLLARAEAGPVVVRAAQLYYADPLAVFSPERSGQGTSADVAWRIRGGVSAELSGWRGRNFQAPLGQGLFQSRNPEDLMSWHRTGRSLLGLGLAWEGRSSLRIRGWYDVADRSLQPSVTWVRYVVLDPR